MFLYKEKGFAIDKKYIWSSLQNKIKYGTVLMNGKQTYAHLYTHKTCNSPFYTQIKSYFFSSFTVYVSIDLNVLAFNFFIQCEILSYSILLTLLSFYIIKHCHVRSKASLLPHCWEANGIHISKHTARSSSRGGVKAYRSHIYSISD